MVETRSPSNPGLPEDPVMFNVMTEIDMIAHMAEVEFQRLLPGDLTPAQFGVLNRLLRLDILETVGELAIAFQVAQPTMSSTVKRLEAKGYIRIIPDKDDRRVKRIKATAAGKAIRKKSIGALDPYWAMLAQEAPAEIADADWSKILKALTTLRDFMEQRVG